MINLTSKALPNTVMVGGKAFSINTDYRLWMRFEIELSKGVLPLEVGYLFRSEVPKSCDINELLVFARPRSIVPRSIGNDHVISLDYEIDGDYIYSAFMEQYGIDLIDIEYLHWHKFLALLKGLNSSVKLSEIMGYRCYKKAKKDEDIYEKLKYAWSIDKNEYEEENQEELEEFNKAFTRSK